MWCSIWSGGVLAFTTVMMIFCGDFAYKIHGGLFKLSRESFDIAIYSYLGNFKICFICFALVPYLALLMMQ